MLTHCSVDFENGISTTKATLLNILTFFKALNRGLFLAFWLNHCLRAIEKLPPNLGRGTQMLKNRNEGKRICGYWSSIESFLLTLKAIHVSENGKETTAKFAGGRNLCSVIWCCVFKVACTMFLKNSNLQ